MKVTTATSPGAVEVIDAALPEVGPRDVLVRMRAYMTVYESPSIALSPIETGRSTVQTMSAKERH
jgi:hypothetical protein